MDVHPPCHPLDHDHVSRANVGHFSPVTRSPARAAPTSTLHTSLGMERMTMPLIPEQDDTSSVGSLDLAEFSPPPLRTKRSGSLMNTLFGTVHHTPSGHRREPVTPTTTPSDNTPAPSSPAPLGLLGRRRSVSVTERSAASPSMAHRVRGIFQRRGSLAVSHPPPEIRLQSEPEAEEQPAAPTEDEREMDHRLDTKIALMVERMTLEGRSEEAIARAIAAEHETEQTRRRPRLPSDRPPPSPAALATRAQNHRHMYIPGTPVLAPPAEPEFMRRFLDSINRAMGFEEERTGQNGASNITVPQGFVVPPNLVTRQAAAAAASGAPGAAPGAASTHPLFSNSYETLSRLQDVKKGCQNVDMLPTRTYNGEKLPDGQEVCAVCIGDYEAGEVVRYLPCFHFFHAECVDTWLMGSDLCPVCKYEIPQK
eukprot:TRINITY_DN6489_c0_g1_i1.p1 TRINITY_DN6489_c0_g1~~TRINITY_DN6489_c0_g1_i1.p1  ORF type:complete len:424 (-),score=86.79 TRINITY_DN6489_c0_g1_i1:148-1419(-)